MNDFLYGMIGGMFGANMASNINKPTYNYNENTNYSGLTSEQKKSNRLKEQELELQKKVIKKQEIKEYLDSIDINIDRDCLEIDLHDKDYQGECYVELSELANKEQDGRWHDEKFARVYARLTKSKCQKEQDLCRAYEKIFMGKDIEFGPIVGRSEDRYDYVMRWVS